MFGSLAKYNEKPLTLFQRACWAQGMLRCWDALSFSSTNKMKQVLQKLLTNEPFFLVLQIQRCSKAVGRIFTTLVLWIFLMHKLSYYWEQYLRKVPLSLVRSIGFDYKMSN